MKLDMKPHKDVREQRLAGLAVGVLVLIVLIHLKLPVWPILKGGGVAAFLTAEATGSIASDLLVGLFSAYVFYLVIELYPTYRRNKETLESLNLLVASVADAYETPSAFAHQRSIESVDLTVLDRLAALKEKVINDPHLYDLKSAMETGHSRYQDVQHALHMATSVSPKHAVAWLVLTDKLRLLAQECDAYPESPFAENPSSEPMAEQEKYQKKMNALTEALKQRVLEVLEASIYWREQQAL